MEDKSNTASNPMMIVGKMLPLVGQLMPMVEKARLRWAWSGYMKAALPPLVQAGLAQGLSIEAIAAEAMKVADAMMLHENKRPLEIK